MSTPLGATALGEGRTHFNVWAPHAERVEVVLADRGPVETAAVEMTSVETAAVEMARVGEGYHQATVDGCGPGARYRYRLHRDGQPAVERADPASRWQPDGVHGPSAVDELHPAWSDSGWRTPPLHEQVLYEVHVGTFSDAGTFDGVIEHLDALAELGVTTLEVMPVWQFPGARNWGYDGVLAYAVQDTYGGPAGLRRLVDAAHARGLAVVLDVVYNHFGPEGNHLTDFGPYLAGHTTTPWGAAVNVDGPGSDGVRRYLVENAVRWIRDFHLDGLRLDAVHAILDTSAVHLLEEIATAVHAEADRLGRDTHVVAESDLADPRLVRPVELGGYGLDGQWLDDVHHALHVATTGEQRGYLADYSGLADLARSLRQRYALAGSYSQHRGRTVGRPAPDVPYARFVACTQNHDQVGNRMHGERHTALLDLEARKLTTAALLLLPFTPLLFMGQEYGETAPFPYFVSHTDEDLIAAVRTGRAREFAFRDAGEPPDPQAEATFASAKLDHTLAGHGEHAVMHELTRELLRLRRETPSIAHPAAGDAVPHLAGPATLMVTRGEYAGWSHPAVALVAHAGAAATEVTLPATARWTRVLDTAEPRWAGPGGSKLEADGGLQRLTTAARSAVLLVAKAGER